MALTQFLDLTCRCQALERSHQARKTQGHSALIASEAHLIIIDNKIATSLGLSFVISSIAPRCFICVVALRSLRYAMMLCIWHSTACVCDVCDVVHRGDGGAAVR